MQRMVDLLNENKQLSTESSVSKDQELDGHPDTDAMFDRLAGNIPPINWLIFLFTCPSSLDLLDSTNILLEVVI